MRHQMKYGLLIFVLLTVFFMCKEKTNPADSAPTIASLPNVEGEWTLEWENGIHQIQLDLEGKKILFDGNEGLELDLDSMGIRIRAYDEETVKGYFLYSDIKSKSWIGTWENRVVRLIHRK